MSDDQIQTIRVITKKEGGCLSGCGTVLGLLFLVGLAIEYPYVAIPVAVVALGVGLWYWNEQQKTPTPQAAPQTPPAPVPVERALAPGAPSSGSTVVADRAQALEQLKNANELREQGHLSQEEFDRIKAELLKRI